MTEDFKKGLATGLAIGGVQEGGTSGAGGITIIDEILETVIQMSVMIINVEE